jgi:hypothetical protein
VLARYAVAQVREGRRVGNRLNVRDVLSTYCQRRKNLNVERLDKFDEEEGAWLEAIVEDPHTPVFDQVWFRIDFPAWLTTLHDRDRHIALKLASGETTGGTAKRFNVSPARISQLRRELCESWRMFHGEKTATRVTRPA